MFDASTTGNQLENKDTINRNPSTRSRKSLLRSPAPQKDARSNKLRASLQRSGSLGCFPSPCDSGERRIDSDSDSFGDSRPSTRAGPVAGFESCANCEGFLLEGVELAGRIGSPNHTRTTMRCGEAGVLHAVCPNRVWLYTVLSEGSIEER